jgi:Icc-related predicted phosphoesterase
MALAGFMLALLAAAPACKRKKPGVDAGPVVAPETQLKPVAEHAGGVSNRCVGTLDRSGSPKELTIAGKKWRKQGYELTLTQKDADDRATIGLVSDIKDATEGTLANLRYFIAEMKKRGAEAIIATGDIAEEAPDIRSVMVTLADSDLPTFVIIGNMESLKDYDAAVASVSQTRPNLVDLNRTRFVGGDDFDLVSLPGYHDASHVRSTDGCAYKPADVADVRKLVARATQPVVFVSHGPPRGTGPSSLDMLSEKEGHVGDAKLSHLIQTANIPFGVFGNVMEQGGNGVAADFDTRVPAGTFAEKLYVNVGRASAVPWSLANGEISHGMAMVLRIAARKASYEVLRAPAQGGAQKKAPPAPRKPGAPVKGAAPTKGPAPAPAPQK